VSDQPKRVPEPVRVTLELFYSMLNCLSVEHRAMVFKDLKATYHFALLDADVSADDESDA
jgi:hypothetical protein